MSMPIEKVLPSEAGVLLHGSTVDVCAALDRIVRAVHYNHDPEIDAEAQAHIVGLVHECLSVVGVPPARAELFAAAVALGFGLRGGIAAAYPCPDTVEPEPYEII